MTPNQDDLITRFLLGELSEEERREVEERFLSDNAFFEQMLAAEDALMDDYVCGTLSQEQSLRARALFESSREQRQNAEFTNQLLSLVKSRQHKSTPHASVLPPPNLGQHTSRVVWSVIALLFVLLGSWSLYLYNRLRTLSAREAAAEQAARQVNATLQAEFARQNQLKEELESERRQKEALIAQLQSRGLQSSITVTLKPVQFERGGNSNLETVKISSAQIKLRLVLEGDQEYEKYSVAITTFSGRPVRNFSLTANQVQQGMIIMTLPASLMGPDDFKIELTGALANGEFQHIADYAFRLAR